MDRRDFVRNAGIVLAAGSVGSAASKLSASALLPQATQDQSYGQTLKTLAAKSGKIVAMFTTAHDLQYTKGEAQTIQQEFTMIADGNDLKMDRLRPTPQTYDFTGADWVVAWAQKSGLQMRGHTLVWHIGLPSWFNSYVTKDNAKQFMVDHITNVVGRYAGKMYAWDVVNEVIHADGRPDQLRAKPWLALIGPDYIETAFRAAHAADPKAKLLINENTLEYTEGFHHDRRNALVDLVTKLKSENVPIHAVGLQSHLKAGKQLGGDELQAMLQKIRDLGLEVMITELDVDDSGLSGDAREDGVAQAYAEYLDTVGKYVHVITFEQVADNPNLPKRADGLTPHPNLWDAQHNKKAAYTAVSASLSKLPKRG